MSDFNEETARYLIEQSFPTEFPAGMERSSPQQEERLNILYQKSATLFAPYNHWEILCWISDAMIAMTPYSPVPGQPPPFPVEHGIALFNHLALHEGADNYELIATLAACLARLLSMIRAQQ